MHHHKLSSHLNSSLVGGGTLVANNTAANDQSRSSILTDSTDDFSNLHRNTQHISTQHQITTPLTCSIDDDHENDHHMMPISIYTNISPLSASDFENTNRQLHHGSTTTTCSSGSTLSSESWAVGSGGAASCSAASSSGIATMSSDEPNASTSDPLLTNDGASSSSATVTEAILVPSTSNNYPSSAFTPVTTNNTLTSGTTHQISTDTNITSTSPIAAVTTTITNLSSTDQRLRDPFSESSWPFPAGQSLTSVSCVSSTKPSDVICKPWRNLVSQNRRRYKGDHFDLDLTYITDRIIAMGFPALDQEKIYRNDMKETVNFLEHYHANHYMVFNLRGHHIYNPSYFHNRVMMFEMNDHHPPRLELMAPFCRAVHDYLAADDRNVVAVHCKAGKGRTGVMICAYLVYINFYLSPRQNMDYYSIVRTVNNKGVTIPSQRRYVYYFSHLRKRNLNYMPLRSELIGVYFERPPSLNGLLYDGAFRLRVANGDVDVFIPGPLKLSGKRFDEEEQIWKRFSCGVGEDQHDPYNPQPNRDVISRRCYGWTVPSNKRVFIEGDVRVDLYAKKCVKGLNWTLKDREKLGHIWFNTMFTCPEFCGGVYVHGDEAYPYPKGGTTIVNRWPKNEKSSSSGPPSPSSDTEKTSTSALERVMEIQSGEQHHLRKTKSKKNHKSRSSHTRKGNECDDDLLLPYCDIEHPPGMDAHCPQHCLPLIYPRERGRNPPREGIKEMLRDAHLKDIIADHYNQRRQSMAVGELIPKAPIGRPDCNGPYCLMRQPDEHVLEFSVLEIDRASKSDKFDVGTKVYVVVRCVNLDDPSEAGLAEKAIQEIHEAQARINAAKNEEMRRKSGMARGCDNTSDSISSQSSSSLSGDALNDQPWRDDPRVDDPFLRRYFFKQRRDSFSKHPPVDYRCPLQESNRTSTLLSNHSTSMMDEDSVERKVAQHQQPNGVTSLQSDSSLNVVESTNYSTTKLSNENLLMDNASEDFRETQDGRWLDESSESED